jgi:hypothetical protein
MLRVHGIALATRLSAGHIDSHGLRRLVILLARHLRRLIHPHRAAHIHLLVITLTLQHPELVEISHLHSAHLLPRELHASLELLGLNWLRWVLLWSGSSTSYFVHRILFVSFQGQKHRVLSVSDLQVIGEVSLVVPGGHLELRVGTSNQSLQVFVVPGLT